MKTRIAKITRERMGDRANALESLTPGPNLSASEIVTVVRRLGFVLLRAYEIMQGNLISAGNHSLAETLGDTLKPLADMLVHFELVEEEETPDGEVP